MQHQFFQLASQSYSKCHGPFEEILTMGEGTIQRKGHGNNNKNNNNNDNDSNTYKRNNNKFFMEGYPISYNT